MTRALGAALLGMALALSAAAFDSPSLFVPGLALLALGTVAGAWVTLAAAGARLERTLGPHVVEEEEAYPLVLEFRAGVLPPPGGELDEPLLAEPVPLAGRWQRRVRVDVRFGRRGRRAIEPGRAVIRDPLRLGVRSLPPPPPGEVIVLPRVEPVLVSDRGGVHGGLGELGRPLTSAASELELDSLRPYRQGAPASRIHWPTVARTGALVERRLVADADARPLVVLDTRGPPSPGSIDMAVRAAASLVVHLARGGGCSLLLPGDRRPVDVDEDLHAWPALHVRLALLEADERPPSAARLQRSGPIFWVAARAPGRLPAGLARAAASGRYLVIPDEGARGTPVFSVAGCSGFRLGRAGRRRAA